MPKIINTSSDLLQLITETSRKIFSNFMEFYQALPLHSRTLDLKTIAFVCCISIGILFLVSLVRTRNISGNDSPLSPIVLKRTKSAP